MFRRAATGFKKILSRGMASTSVKLPRAAQILHITDTEGTSAFTASIKRSKIVTLQDNVLSFHPQAKNPFLIYGGDATDRGTDDLPTLKMLVNFKEQYPDRVILLVGNREIKQCAFKTELHPRWIRERLLKGESPAWLAEKTFPRDYITQGPATEEYLATRSISDCQLMYLKWMLEKTMGCPHTFRYRREELTTMLGKYVTDEQVLDSFMFESSAAGLVGKYLQLGQVGVIVPDTHVLAVHGGLTAENIGRVPNMQPDEPPIQNAHEWINQFNAWYQAEIQKWKTQKITHLETKPRTTPLDESVLPIPGKTKYVITASMQGANREFQDTPPSVLRYLQENNISVVLTGHQPCGDHPAIVRGGGNILLINGDTGYAKFDPTQPDDTRGGACHTLEIDAGVSETHIRIDATLPDQSTVHTVMTVSGNEITGDAYIGKILKNGFLVQCKLSEDSYRLILQAGHHVEYKIVSPLELAALLDETREQSVKKSGLTP